MPSWLLHVDWPIVAALTSLALSALLAAWGLWSDRSKGRPRCPRCWYDMRAHASLVCPECGHDARTLPQLLKHRRRRGAIFLALLLASPSACLCLVIADWRWDRAAANQITRDLGITPGTRRGGPTLLVTRLPKSLQLYFQRADWSKVTDLRTNVAPTKLHHLARLHQLRHLTLQNSALDDDALRHLQTLPHLEELILDGTAVTDAGLSHLAKLTHLQRLSLRRTTVQGAGLSALHDLTSLTHLCLAETPLHDDQLGGLSALRTLEMLDLSETSIGDIGLQHLLTLHNLQTLVLTGTAVSDAGAPRLARLRALRILLLDETAVTDAAMPVLGGISALEMLQLTGTVVTDAGLAALRGHPHLRALYLPSNQSVRGQFTRVGIPGVSHPLAPDHPFENHPSWSVIPKTSADIGAFLTTVTGTNGVVLQAGFVPYKTTLVWGEPLYVTYVVRNISTTTTDFRYYDADLSISARSAIETSPASVGMQPVIWSSPRWYFISAPGATFTRRMALTAHPPIAGPGVYQVNCSLPISGDGAPVRTQFHLTIRPRTEKRVQQTLAEYVALLRTSSTEATNELMETMHAFAPAEALTMIRSLTHGVETNQRAAALRALGRHARNENWFTAEMLAALADENEQVRLAATEALHGISEPRALTALQSRWRHEPITLAGPMLRTLGASQSTAVLADLRAAFDADDPALRSAALTALTLHASNDARELLLSRVSGPDIRDREAVVRTLVKQFKVQLQPEWLIPAEWAARQMGRWSDMRNLCIVHANNERSAAALVACLDFSNPTTRLDNNRMIIYALDRIQGAPPHPWFYVPNQTTVADQIAGVNTNRATLAALSTWLDAWEAKHQTTFRPAPPTVPLISGRCIRPDGTPVANLEISLNVFIPDQSRHSHDAATDAAGRYAFPAYLPTAQYSLTIWATPTGGNGAGAVTTIGPQPDIIVRSR